MSEIEAAPTPEEISEHTSRLKADFPNLDVKKVSVIGRGWHHTALEVNDALIFRVPRGVYDLEKLASSVHCETEVLKRLKGKVPVAIPDPTYIAPNNAYFGYAKLEGVILETEAPSFDESNRRVLMDDWVTIASAIHQEITPNEARALGVPEFDGTDTTMAERIFNLPNLGKDILDFADRTIKGVKSLDMHSQHQVFIHNDLQFHNLLADPITNRVSGIIDWTDVCVAPVAREFATGEWMKGNLVDEAAALYESKTGVNVDANQARMWRSIEELGDYVAQIESKELEGAAETLASIRELITN